MNPDFRDDLRPERLFDFAIIAVQFLLLLAVVRGFHVESAGFLRILSLAFVGFFLQHWLPPRLRAPVFVLVSLAGLALLFGIANAGWMIAILLGFLGFAHLPVAFSLRLVLIVAFGVLLAMLRAGGIASPWPGIIWPILGSMFMFRLIVYLYDLRNRSAPFDLWTSLAYLLMLPNACFPLFPVVDYKLFSRSRKDSGTERYTTYQSGIDAMFRGLVQLLLYRLVYQNLSVEVTALDSASEAALYLVRPYLLYLKISGSFHFVIGILNMYGYALPRTNHNYFLASSFTDYWRRINIYWKDFVQKIFFNPAYFSLSRRFGGTSSLVAATLIAFLATWALHSYQWFWIRGTFPVVWQDVVFWSFMGVVVLVNMIVETRRGRRRSLKPPKRTFRSDLGLATRTVLTFLVICASWAVWSVQSVGELQVMLELLARPSAMDLLRIVGGLLVLGCTSVFYDRWEARIKGRKSGLGRFGVGPIRFGWPALRVSVGAGILAFAAFAPLLLYFDSNVAQAIDKLRNPLRLSGRDAQALDRGYYEDLTDVARFNPELAEVYAERPADWERCWAIHRTGGFPTHVLLPNRKVAFKGAMMSTNALAMRDREYNQVKPEDTYRVALIGASHSMGTGVEDWQVFENLVEDRLNQSLPTGTAKVEILNFSVGGHGPLSRLFYLEHKLSEFDIDALVFVAIDDIGWARREFLNGVLGEYELLWPELNQMADKWGLDSGMDQILAEARMKAHNEELLGWIYRRVEEAARLNEFEPFLLVIPRPREESNERMAQVRTQISVAERSGLTVVEVLDVYKTDIPFDQLWIAAWDRHPNARGHELLAEATYKVLAPHLKPRS